MATDKELAQLAKKLDDGQGAYGCLTILCLAIPAVLLYFLGDWVGSWFGSEAARFGRALAPWLPVLPYVVLLRNMIRADRKRRWQIERDLDHQEVEEIRVAGGEVGLIGAPKPSRNNALVFALPDRKLLYLQLLPELFEPPTYGADKDAAVAKGEVLNRLAAPYSFPNTEFVVTRFAQSGDVISIQTAGDYAAPKQLRPSLRSVELFRPSEMFTGTLKQISEVIEIEQAQRKRGDTL